MYFVMLFCPWIQETVAMTRRQEAELEVAELKMLRFSSGVARMDRIRNEHVRGTAQVGQFSAKVREERLIPLSQKHPPIIRIRIMLDNSIKIAITNSELPNIICILFTERPCVRKTLTRRMSVRGRGDL